MEEALLLHLLRDVFEAVKKDLGLYRSPELNTAQKLFYWVFATHRGIFGYFGQPPVAPKWVGGRSTPKCFQGVYERLYKKDSGTKELTKSVPQLGS